MASKDKEIAMESNDTEECARLRKEVLYFKQLSMKLEVKSLIKQNFKDEILIVREESKRIKDPMIAKNKDLEATKNSLNGMKVEIESEQWFIG